MKRQITISIALLLAATLEAHALDGKFRGVYVCAKLPTTRDILRTPIDLIVHDNAVHFARPLFDLDGTRVTGTELAAGTIGDDGSLKLTSEWNYLGNSAQANYTGTLTAAGGTLMGNQDWRGPDGGTPLSRPCAAAFVPAPQTSSAPRADDGGTDATEDEQ